MASDDSYSEAVRDLHNDLVDKMSEMIVYQSLHWNRLLGKLNDNPLTPQDKHAIKSIQNLFETLIEKKYISYGNYEKLINKLRGIHNLAATEVTNWETMINKQIKLDKESRKSRKRKRSDNDEKAEGQGLSDAQEDRKRKKTQRETSGSGRTVTKDEKLKLHADMVTKLNEELSSNMIKPWATFKNNMRYKLRFGAAVLAEITDMYSACITMKAKGKIDIGKYDKLIEVVEDIDDNLVDIINEYLEKMGIDPTPTRTLMRLRSSDSS